MKLWSPEHAALLEALRADHVVPKLWRRLSFERYEASSHEIETLRDWPQSLMEDAASWLEVEAALETPEAWPHAWNQATAQGWSTPNHHHHALLFWEFTTRFLRDKEYEHAAWSWEQTLRAWEGFLGDEGYIRALLRSVVGDSAQEGEEGSDEFVSVVRELPLPLIRTMVKGLRESTGLDRPTGIKAAVDRQGLRFMWWALGKVGQWRGEGGDPFGALSGGVAQAEAGQKRVVKEVLDRWGESLEAMDLSAIEQKLASVPFEVLQTVAEVVGIDAMSAVHVVEKVVEVGWKLEKLGRGKPGGLLDDVIGNTRIFNDALERHIGSGVAFGHQSKCADFLVFEGDLCRDRTVRHALFARALEVCPGHRNAALLLCHERIKQVAGLLAHVESMGSVGLMLPRGRDRARELVGEMHQRLEQAWEVYPFDEDFGAYALKVETMASRLGVSLPPAPQAWRQAIDEARRAGDVR